MQLKQECVRQVLLAIEDSDFKKDMRLNHFKESSYSTDFSDEDIVYTVERLLDAGLLEAIIKYGVQNRLMVFRVTNLTWDGHQFLDNIRDDGVWKETKKVTSKVAGVSVQILSDVASSILRKSLGLD